MEGPAYLPVHVTRHAFNKVNLARCSLQCAATPVEMGGQKALRDSIHSCHLADAGWGLKWPP